MDQRIIDKIHSIAEEIYRQELALQKEINEYTNNLFTPEVREMMKAIKDAKGDQFYLYYVEGKARIEIWYESCVIDISNGKYCSPHFERLGEGLIDLSKLQEGSSGISVIKRHTEILQEQREMFEYFQDNAEVLLEEIVDIYENIVNKQLATLDEISTMLNIDEKPIKHIKVTVEYI